MEGRLVKNTGVRRFHLKAADESLAWAQRKYTDPQRCQLDFWSWATGLETHQLLRRDIPEQENVLSQSEAWPWLKLQRRAGRFVEKLFEGFESDRPHLVHVMPRSLIRLPSKTSPAIVRWFPPLRVPDTPWDWFILFFDEVLTKLDGASADIVDKCPVCKRWFIRTRAGTKKVCSDACRSRALYQSRKAKEEQRRLAKQSKQERRAQPEAMSKPRARSKGAR
jgi:hypothetical protein